MPFFPFFTCSLSISNSFYRILRSTRYSFPARQRALFYHHEIHDGHMSSFTVKIRRKADAFRAGASIDPLRPLVWIGLINLLFYMVFSLIPLFLPETDLSHFPPYIALPEGDFDLSNYYFLSAFLALNAVAIFSLFLAALKISGNQPQRAPIEISAARRQFSFDRLTTCILFFAVVFHVVMFLNPTLLSTDMFDYIRHGRIFAIYGENPLVVPATYFQEGPFYDMGGWVSTGSVYGPIHVYVTGALARLAGDGFIPNFLLFKGFFLSMNLVNLVLIWRIAARLVPGLERKALIFYGWNPFILILVAANAHNDILMLTLVLAGFLLYMKKQVILGALVVTLAVLVKFIALPILLLYLVLAFRKQKRVLAGMAVVGTSLVAAVAVTVITYLPLWAGSDTFKFMSSVGSKANYSLPGMLRDLVAGHMPLSFSQTLVQLLMAALLAAYLIWHIFGVRNLPSLVSASAGIAFLAPLALFWFQPWYLTLALGLIALRPWRYLYLAALAYSFTGMFFDGFWWHTPFSMDIQKPLRVLVVFGPPVLLLLFLKARDVIPIAWNKTVEWSLADTSSGKGDEDGVVDPSRSRMLIEVAALLMAAAVPVAAVISTSPQLRSFVDLVIVKLQLLTNI